MRPWGRWVGLGLVALLLVALLGRTLGAQLPQLVGWVQRMGAWAPLALVLTYTVATVALAPGSVLTVASGALFGLTWGTVYAFAGATLGAMAAFLVSRHLARAAVERRLAGDARFQRLDRAIGRQGRRVVFLLRLSPVFPFALLNYALGLTRVRFVDYSLASIGMLPGTVLYVYQGMLVGEVAALGAGTATPRGPGYYALLAVGLAATVAVTVFVTRLARRALREDIPEEGHEPTS